jgi:hypothetical protein
MPKPSNPSDSSDPSNPPGGRALGRIIGLGALGLAGLVGFVALAVACTGPAGPPTSTTAPTSTVVGVDCPYVFPDLSGAAGAGAGYAGPAVSVSCSDTELLVSSNGMPGYPFVPRTPNPLGAQNWRWHVPRNPTVATSPTSVATRFGTIGFTVTGLPIYAAMEGAQPAAEAFGDPVYNGILDSCKGHTGPNREYHYHALEQSASCLLDEQILGYAIDGIPIYGSAGCVDLACTQVHTFRSGWVRTGDPTTNAWANHTNQASSDPDVLDRCNGRIGPDGTYRYQATSTFPYTIGCFAGTPVTQSGAAGGPMPPM